MKQPEYEPPNRKGSIKHHDFRGPTPNDYCDQQDCHSPSEAVRARYLQVGRQRFVLCCALVCFNGILTGWIILVKPAGDLSQLLQSCGRIHDELPIALCLATTSLIVSRQFFFPGAHERRTIG